MNLPLVRPVLRATLVALVLAVQIPELAVGDQLAEATALNQQAIALFQQARYAEAESLLKIALAIREQARGVEHPDVAQILNNLALLYKQQARYAEAEPLYKRALAIREKVLGSDHPDVATVLNNLGALYEVQGLDAEAEPLFKRALEIRENALGPNHLAVAVSLNNLATSHDDQGRYAEAEPLFKRALAIREKVLGPNHPDVATTLNNLADLYDKQGHYAEAEPLYKRALAIREKVLSPNHPDVAASLSGLALLYRQQARYPEAEQLYKRGLAIREKALGPDHPDVAASLNSLALLYRQQSRYPEAEPLYKRALAIGEKTFGPEHPEVAAILNNLAAVYELQGRYAEPEPLYKRALAIRENAFGPNHPEVAQSEDNLAALYQAQGRYAEAEPLYKRAMEIEEKALGPDHPDFATMLNNLAGLYQAQRRYTEAEPIFKHAMTVREKALGQDHPNLAESLNNLAGLYQVQGRGAEAEPLYKRALAIYEKEFGPNHPTAAISLNNLALLYLAEAQLDQALAASTQAVEIMIEHLSIGSGQRSGAAIAEQRSDRSYFTNYIAIADAAARKTPERRRATVADTFRVVQMAQASTTGAAVAALAARVAAGSGSRAAMIRERQDLVQQWQGLDGALVKAASRPRADRRPVEETSLRAALEDATRKLDGLDARIAAEFPDLMEVSNPKPLTAEAAQELLADDEALLVYLATDGVTWLWVLRHGDLGFYQIEIGAKDLAREVMALRARLDPDFNPDLYPFPAEHANALYQKILSPAEPLLAGVRHLLIVPDGALQSLPLGVLVTRSPAHDPETLAEHRDIAWLARDYAVTVLPSVSSLRGLRQFANAEHASAPFLGIGNPVLNGVSGQERGVVLARLFRGAVADVEQVRVLPPLPETADELRAIAQKMGATEDDLLLGERASEPVLRQTPLDHYRVVAFATHGLMSGDLKGLAEPALVLTPPEEATPDNDGLLTASKIATLKFNADWVVLSAGNTAAGDGTPDGGGLSGLAKAFFYAGARSLLVSHWPVWSKATVTLTTGAFAELAQDPTIGRAEALRRAEMVMLDPAEPPEFAHPLAWAPFVLAGEGGAER